VRWDDLFDDLEAQLEQLAEAELAGEVAERSRIEVSKFGLVDRLRPAIGQPVTVTVPGGPALVGTLRGVGASWLLLTGSRGPEVLVPLAAVSTVAGLGSVSAVPGSAGRVAERLTLAHALRGIARDRSGVAVGLRDGAVFTGTIDRVGSDFFEIAEHPIDEARRRGNVAGMRTVPMQAVALIRRTL
jgi:hypothetical protein